MVVSSVCAGPRKLFRLRALGRLRTMSSPPAAAAVQDAMAWKPPASPHEEQRVIDRAYAEYVLPADEAKRLLTGGVKSPRKPNGSPPRKPGSALSGSSSSRRRGGSHRQGQEAIVNLTSNEEIFDGHIGGRSNASVQVCLVIPAVLL